VNVLKLGSVALIVEKWMIEECLKIKNDIEIT